MKEFFRTQVTRGEILRQPARASATRFTCYIFVRWYTASPLPPRTSLQRATLAVGVGVTAVATTYCASRPYVVLKKQHRPSSSKYIFALTLGLGLRALRTAAFPIFKGNELHSTSSLVQSLERYRWQISSVDCKLIPTVRWAAAKECRTALRIALYRSITSPASSEVSMVESAESAIQSIGSRCCFQSSSEAYTSTAGCSNTKNLRVVVHIIGKAAPSVWNGRPCWGIMPKGKEWCASMKWARRHSLHVDAIPRLMPARMTKL